MFVCDITLSSGQKEGKKGKEDIFSNPVAVIALSRRRRVCISNVLVSEQGRSYPMTEVNRIFSCCSMQESKFSFSHPSFFCREICVSVSNNFMNSSYKALPLNFDNLLMGSAEIAKTEWARVSWFFLEAYRKEHKIGFSFGRHRSSHCFQCRGCVKYTNCSAMKKLNRFLSLVVGQ